MNELVDWYRAQLDEDERVARAATAGPWRWDGDEYADDPPRPLKDPVRDGWGDRGPDLMSRNEPVLGAFGYDASAVVVKRADAEHIARHDPARVLREVAAKRAIVVEVRRHEGAIRQESAIAQVGDPIPTNLYAARDALLHAVRLLASAYADRPGYREEWKP